MNRKAKVNFAIAGLLLTANIVEGFVKAKEQHKKDKQIETLIAELRMGMVNNVTNITSEVRDEETGTFTSINQGTIGTDEFGRDVQGIEIKASEGISIDQKLDNLRNEIEADLSELRAEVLELGSNR